MFLFILPDINSPSNSIFYIDLLFKSTFVLTTKLSLNLVDYLSKPANIEDIISSLLVSKDEKAPPPDEPMSANRVRWEHIQRVYELCNKNVSETARRLKMHRRTLQRILSKRAPK